jgi:predicted dehydrogenase
MSESVRWAILGTGNIAHQFARGLAVLPDAELVAIGSRQQASADRFGEAFAVPHRHASYEAAAANPDVDAVYVSTPHARHCDDTLLGLDHGKAVLCEKPFAINTAQTDAMIARARQRGCFLMEAMWTCCLPAIRKLHALVADGAVGNVRLVRAEFCFRAAYDPTHRLFDPALGGGALLDVGVYTLAFAWLIFNRPPTDIVTRVHKAPTGVDEYSAVTLAYDDGAIAVLTSAIRAELPLEAVIAGDEGTIHVPEFSHADRFTLSRGGKDETFRFDRVANGYNHEAAEVRRCLRDGRTESDIIPLAQTRGVMRIMDRIRAQWGVAYPGESLPELGERSGDEGR